MNKTISYAEASVAVSEYLYNLDLSSAVDILKEKFGVNVDFDGEVILNGKTILDSTFDGFMIDFIENLSAASVVMVYSLMNDREFDLDDAGTNLVEVS